ncbi:Golgi SNAP receptor complex member 1 [Balamuthia mandrillaris]
MATFDELRKEARKLETTLDLKLVSYSKFGANFAHSSLLREGSSDTVSLLKNSEHVANSMALEVEQLLSKLSELNEEMGRCATAINYPHHLQHHRQKLHEYSQEFNKTRSNILATREHAELLISVQQDITYGLSLALSSCSFALWCLPLLLSKPLLAISKTRASVRGQTAFFVNVVLFMVPIMY